MSARNPVKQAVQVLLALDVRPGDLLAPDKRCVDWWPEVVAMEALIACAPPGAALVDESSGLRWENGGGRWFCEDGQEGDESIVANQGGPLRVVAWPRAGDV